MSSAKKTSILFGLVLLIIIMIPIFIPSSFARVDYEDVDRIQVIDESMIGKIYKVETLIDEYGIEILYKVNGEIVAITPGRNNCMGDLETGYNEYTGMYYYFCPPEFEYDVFHTLGYDTPAGSLTNGIGYISDYWKLVDVRDTGAYGSEGSGRVATFEAYFEKEVRNDNITTGTVLPKGSPLIACSIVNYYNENNELIDTIELEYSNADMTADQIFNEHYTELDYYVGLSNYNLQSYDYWKIRGYNNGGYLNYCHSIDLVASGPEEDTHKVTFFNDHNKGNVGLNNNVNYYSLAPGADVNFDINPSYGYQVSNVRVVDEDGRVINYQSNNGHYSFTMPNKDINVYVEYEKVKSNVRVEVVDETDDITISLEDLTRVEYEEEVIFKVTPIKGYQINDIKVIKDNGDEIEFFATDNKNEFSFIMPGEDVTIIPSYERVKNSVVVEDNNNTKEIKIEVNDASAVVYEDRVIFSVVPEDGYVVDKIIIKDEQGNEISYKKTNNENEYSFIMPDKDVIIKPMYKLKNNNIFDLINNPKTGVGIMIIVILLISAIVAGIILSKKKKVIN